MSLRNRVLKWAYQAGYHIVDGHIFSPKGKELKGCIRRGYHEFTYRIPVSSQLRSRLTCPVKVHRLVALQKYGDVVFEKGVLARHKDNNPLNNLPDNILIGTQSDNMMDNPVEMRNRVAREAAQNRRVMTDGQITQMREDRSRGMTYSQIAVKYGLRNKGHAHYMVNHQYVTSK